MLLRTTSVDGSVAVVKPTPAPLTAPVHKVDTCTPFEGPDVAMPAHCDAAHTIDPSVLGADTGVQCRPPSSVLETPVVYVSGPDLPMRPSTKQVCPELQVT